MDAAPQDDDDNPVYGLYYHPDGQRIDNWESEVIDGNDYYDT